MKRKKITDRVRMKQVQTNEVLLELLPKRLRRELKKRLSLIRLAKTGFFQKADIVHYSIEGELKLHRKVLDKALIDSFSPHDVIRGDVELWLDLDNPDFIACCELAMLEPKGVFAAFGAFKQILRGKNARFEGFGGSANKKKKDT